MPTRKANYFESKLSAPDDYTMLNYALPVKYVPMIISALETRKTRSFWLTQDDFERGYQVLSEVQVSLLNPTSFTLVVNELQSLYNLLDQALNGTSRLAFEQPNGGYTYDPEIPPGTPQGLQDGIGNQLGLRRQLLDLQGQLNTGYFNGPARLATIADLVKAGQLSDDTEQGVIPDSIEDLVDLVFSGGGTVAGAVTELFTGTVGNAKDGGFMAVQAGLLGLLATQIGALSVGLQTLITQQATMLNRITFLTGVAPVDPDEFSSLPQYLIDVVGLQNEAQMFGPGYTLWDNVYAMYLASSNINNGVNSIKNVTNTQLPIIATRLGQLLGVENVTDPLVSQSLLILAECICNNVQQINDKTPTGDNFFVAPTSCGSENVLQTYGYWEFTTDGSEATVLTTVALANTGVETRTISPSFDTQVGFIKSDAGTVPGCAQLVVPAGETLPNLAIVIRGWTFTGTEANTQLDYIAPNGTWPDAGPDTDGAFFKFYDQGTPMNPNPRTIVWTCQLTSVVSGNVPAGTYRVYLNRIPEPA